jgi:hypothetical protein
MDSEELRQIIREEIAKTDNSPVIKDVHLHIHGDGLDSFKQLERIASYQRHVLEVQVLKKLLKEGEL